MGRPGSVGGHDAKKRWLKKNPRKTISVSASLYDEIRKEARQEELTLMDMMEIAFRSYKGEVM